MVRAASRIIRGRMGMPAPPIGVRAARNMRRLCIAPQLTIFLRAHVEDRTPFGDAGRPAARHSPSDRLDLPRDPDADGWPLVMGWGSKEPSPLSAGWGGRPRDPARNLNYASADPIARET